MPYKANILILNLLKVKYKYSTFKAAYYLKFLHKFYKILLTLILVSTSILGFSQKDSLNFRKNSIYIEAMGNGGKISYNYDRLIKITKENFMYLRVGLGSDYSSYEDTLSWSSYVLVSELTFPLKLKANKVIFEYGVGYSYYIEPIRYLSNNLEVLEKQNYSVLYLRAGGRYIGEKGLLLRFAFTPTISENYLKDNTLEFGFHFGLSLGYSFNLTRKNI
jgi:hypothetical protein